MKRVCTDCGDTYTCKATRIAQECHDCYEALKQAGFANVRQPADPGLYNPRFNGLQAAEILLDE